MSNGEFVHAHTKYFGENKWCAAHTHAHTHKPMHLLVHIECVKRGELNEHVAKLVSMCDAKHTESNDFCAIKTDAVL